ncbi:MAG: zinc ribbon domain-containing protein [Clostridia bacterium]|nr:zinc ribbon domain-containing protein [Clostridia bacterium]
MDVLDHECPSCGANIPFNPDTQRWDCKYCGASYTLEDFEKYDAEMKKENKEENVNVDMDEYTCPNCGAKVVTDSNTSATSCVYCGSTTILKNRLQGEFKPSQVIPFSQSKEKAVEEFYKFSKKKWFAPKEFCKKENIQKVEGVYIPFWLYDCETKGNIIADAKKISTWRSGDYMYTKTDYYLCQREGNMVFEGVPVDGSTKFADDIMDSIEPYNYEGMKEFNPSYLSGFLAEKYDVEKDDAYSRAKMRVKNTTIEELKNDMKGYNTVNVKENNIEVERKKDKYVLMPVWMLNIKYKDKMHTFAMNGQTGKMVGNVPVSVKKLILTALIIEILLLIISTLIKLFL